MEWYNKIALVGSLLVGVGCYSPMDSVERPLAYFGKNHRFSLCKERLSEDREGLTLRVSVIDTPEIFLEARDIRKREGFFRKVDGKVDSVDCSNVPEGHPLRGLTGEILSAQLREMVPENSKWKIEN